MLGNSEGRTSIIKLLCLRILKYTFLQWRENRQKFSENGQKIIEYIEKSSALDSTVLNPLTVNPPDISCYEKCYNLLVKSYERKYGGFSEAPKFPHLVNLNFLFHVYSREPDSDRGKKALEMCLHTLEMMANGGIRDHIGEVIRDISNLTYYVLNM